MQKDHNLARLAAILFPTNRHFVKNLMDVNDKMVAHYAVLPWKVSDYSMFLN